MANTMDDTNTPKLTKTCNSCGKDKPMSAFLELSGDNTGHYGNICGSCRKTYLEQSKGKDDGSEKTGTGHKIDAKAKVAGDIDRKEEADSVEEEYHEDRDDAEKDDIKELVKSDTLKQTERKHHESFLDRRSSLSEKGKTGTKEGKSHLATQEEAKEQANVSENVREETKKTGFDFLGPMQDTYIAGKQKFSGVHIRQFATWVGKGSALGRSLGAKEPAAGQAESVEKDQTLSEHIENNFGPGSKKR